MTACDVVQSAASLSIHRPAGDEGADEVMAHIAGMNAEELREVSGLSAAMCAKELRMAYEFPNKSLGEAAIRAYTGVVFKSLDCASLSPAALERLNNNVAIISSLYGWLRPDDIIKAYRTDFKMKLAPGDRPLSTWHKKDVTLCLVRRLEEMGYPPILDLMPGDAAACVDRKLVKRFTKIWKVDFKELKDGGDYATPNAGKLKKMRGLLLRAILEQNISDPEELLTLSTPDLLPLGTPDYPDHIAFCV